MRLFKIFKLSVESEALFLREKRGWLPNQLHILGGFHFSLFLFPTSRRLPFHSFVFRLFMKREKKEKASERMTGRRERVKPQRTDGDKTNVTPPPPPRFFALANILRLRRLCDSRTR